MLNTYTDAKALPPAPAYQLSYCIKSQYYTSIVQLQRNNFQPQLLELFTSKPQSGSSARARTNFLVSLGSLER